METENIVNEAHTYVIYARKSTDDSQNQVRSIDDQIAECTQLAQRLGLNVISPPLTEKKSAKKPGQRPMFRQMLTDLKHGKISGIIAWHPDRLARNMKEGGEIIDMVDEGFIKDMKFVTHHFSADPNGKMLLGMAFVLSKQYSDTLSQNVTRGVRRSFAEGKTGGVTKHGYMRDEGGFLRPDGKNFDLIRDAWRMRKEGKSLEAIVAHLHTQGYAKLVKVTGKRVSMTKQMLSEVFKDPLYYGILVQAGQQVDLCSIYNFVPAITEQEYLRVQMLTQKRVTPFKKKQLLRYLPLKMMVLCAICDGHMYAGVSKGKTKNYLFYRCDTKFCKRKKRSIRSKIIFDFIYCFFEEGLNFTEADYHKYYSGLTQLSRKKQQELELTIYSKQSVLKQTETSIRDISYKLVDYDLPPIAKKINEERLVELEEARQTLKTEIATLKQKIPDPEKERITIEQFLNLSKNAGKIIQSADQVVKDAICRLVFLNFSVDEQKVASYQLKPPFDRLLKTRNILSGTEQQTQLELFLEEFLSCILANWDPKPGDIELTESHNPKNYPDYLY